MKVTVTTTATNIIPDAEGFERPFFRNVSSQTVYIGRKASDATPDQGLPVNAGEAFEAYTALSGFTGGKGLFASVASGTAEIRVILL